MFEINNQHLSTYRDFESFQRTESRLSLVVFVGRNGPLSPQLSALRYLRDRYGSLPVFVLPCGYCDPERVKYNIASFPTYLFLRSGREEARFFGRVTGREIEDFLLGVNHDRQSPLH